MQSLDASAPWARYNLPVLLTARNLTRATPLRTLYSSLSITLAPGEILTVRGPSGSGKTRLLRHLAALDPLDDAELLLDGRSPTDLGFQRWRAEVLFVPHATPALPGSPAEFAARLRSLRIQETRQSGARLAPPPTWNLSPSLFEEPWSRLSAGERQRMTIARAVIRDPRILILDEATSSVDTDTEKQIQQALNELVKNRTTIAIAHRLSTLKNSHRLVVLKDGEIQEIGTHEELMAKGGEYCRLVNIQTEMSSITGVGG